MRKTPPIIGLGITVAVGLGFAGISSSGEATIVVGAVLLHELIEHARDIATKLRARSGRK